MPFQYITNLKIQKFCQNEPRFTSVYSINNLPMKKDMTYVINFGGYKSIRTHWIVLYVNDHNVYMNTFQKK